MPPWDASNEESEPVNPDNISTTYRAKDRFWSNGYAISRLISLNSAWRWGSILTAGVLVNFILELTFGLIYKNYALFTSLLNYILAIVVAGVILVGIRLINKWLDRIHPWNKKVWARFLIQAFTNSGYVVVVMVSLRVIMTINNEFGPTSRFVRLLDDAIILTVVVFMAFAIAVIDWGLYLIDSWRTSLAEIERFKKEKIEFQFEMLRNQVNPHFLFNSLNTASSLVYENPETASHFVKQLAKVYRYLLEQQSRDLVSLEDEKSFIMSFIYLMEMRFSKGLSVKIDIPKEKRQWMVIPMALQMLVENAIKHNIISQKKPLTITIEVDTNDYLIVSNNLQLKSSTEYSSKLGLSNIKNRLSYITGKPLIISDFGASFTVKVPLIAPGNEYTDS